MADEELDPAFRGPAPGWEPGDPRPTGRYTPWQQYATQETGNLDVLARARAQPIYGPYAQGRAMFEVARRTARAATNELAAYLRSLPIPASAPWVVRQEGKRGKLYTLADIERNVIARNQAVKRAQEKAAAQKGQQRARATSADLKRFARPVAGAAGVAGAGNVLISQLVDQYYVEKRIRERRGKLPSPVGLPGRTGAKSTRVTYGYTTPGRTGAKSTRVIAAPTTTPRAPGQRMDKPPVVVSAPAESPASESAGSKAARRTMESSKGLVLEWPKSGLQLPTFKLPSWVNTTLRALTPARLSSTVRRVLPRSVGFSTRTSSPSRTSLTPANMLTIGSQTATPGCECPKPKPKQPRASSCTNPRISREVKDGIIITKRKLQCPPSK